MNRAHISVAPVAVLALVLLIVVTAIATGCERTVHVQATTADASVARKLASGGPYALLLSSTTAAGDTTITVTDGSLAPCGSPGFEIQIASPGTNAYDGTTMFSNNSGTQNFSGEIVEYMVIAGNLSNGQIGQYFAYEGARYGQSWH